eukprot:s594_g4.t1
MELPSAVFLALALVIMLGRGFAAARRARRIDEALRKHHPKQEPALAAGFGLFGHLRSVVAALHPALPLGLATAVALWGAQALPVEVRAGLRLDGLVGQALAMGARCQILVGLVKTAKALPLSKWIPKQAEQEEKKMT